jgi:hypothetical protein
VRQVEHFLARASKLAEVLLGRLPVGGMRFCGCLENTKVTNAAAYIDLGDEFPDRLFVVDTFVTTRVVAAHSRVPGVFNIGGNPQILETVIAPIAVDVIDMTVWPLASDVEPSQSVRHV